MFISCLHTRLHVLGSSTELVIAIRTEVK